MVKFIAVIAISALALSQVEALPGFAKKIPNGKAQGHTDGTGESPAVNEFGKAYNKADPWNKEYCMADSDGDGQSNGFELGDPCCTWTAGAATKCTVTSSPGHADEMLEGEALACVEAEAKTCAAASGETSAAGSASAPAETTTAAPKEEEPVGSMDSSASVAGSDSSAEEVGDEDEKKDDSSVIAIQGSVIVAAAVSAVAMLL